MRLFRRVSDVRAFALKKRRGGRVKKVFLMVVNVVQKGGGE